MSKKLTAKAENKKKTIINATLEVLRNKGINLCNHRAVAEEAGVSLGLTTHYFKNLDELLVAAMDSYLTIFESEIDEWFENNHQLGTVDMLTEFMFDSLRDRNFLHYEYEMYVAAISRKALRPYSLKWLRITENKLMKYTHIDNVSAQMIASLMDSVFIRSVMDPDSILLEKENIHESVNALINREQRKHFDVSG
ncbi:TetR family transcriptional regulator [Leclercia adecarboxylata]|uniref:TetR/AcrR family transcriptional regulator n=1 Tax=Leclercia adecarboxylata TaxID=83655 RepID=UPI002DB72125|nr:TetR family transcriptional regulator [Leclercia adecarboxylata]MEB6377745.1 TetR family transcriptional regulator [Leclercia adecarboxylata]